MSARDEYDDDEQDDIESIRQDLDGDLTADEEAAFLDAPEHLIALCALLVARSRLLGIEAQLASVREMARSVELSDKLFALSERRLRLLRQEAQLVELEEFSERYKRLERYELSRRSIEGLIDLVKAATPINFGFCVHLVTDFLRQRDGFWPTKSAVVARLAKRLDIEIDEALRHVDDALDKGLARSRVSIDGGGQFESQVDEDIECYLLHSGAGLREQVNADLAASRRARKRGRTNDH